MNLFSKELPAVRRTQPITKKAKISTTPHVQLLQWLNGKQQQHEISALGNKIMHDFVACDIFVTYVKIVSSCSLETKLRG